MLAPLTEQQVEDMENEMETVEFEKLPLRLAHTCLIACSIKSPQRRSIVKILHGLQ